MNALPLVLTLATYPERCHSPAESGCPFTTVQPVPYGASADIAYQRYTQDFSDLCARPFVLTGSRRRFKTLKAAVAAWKRERGIG